jgi:hypothetical protein
LTLSLSLSTFAAVMAEQAPLLYHLPFFYHYFWPNFYPNNYRQRPSVAVAPQTGHYPQATTSPISETVVVVLLLIISQLLIPCTARSIVKLWPGLREKSIRVVLMLGWYAMMASLVIGARCQLDEAWRSGFETGIGGSTVDGGEMRGGRMEK